MNIQPSWPYTWSITHISSYLLFLLAVHVPVFKFAVVGRNFRWHSFYCSSFWLSLQLEGPFYSRTYKAYWSILGYLKHVWLLLGWIGGPIHDAQIKEPGCFFCLELHYRPRRQGLTCQKPKAPTGISLGNEMSHNVVLLVLCPVLASRLTRWLFQFWLSIKLPNLFVKKRWCCIWDLLAFRL